VAYLRGFKEFHGIALAVDARALIPRPETELLVDRALDEVMRRLTGGSRPAIGPGVQVIDVGTGSGAIAVALAVALRGPAGAHRRGRDPRPSTCRPMRSIWPVRTRSATASGTGSGSPGRISSRRTSLKAQWDVVVANLPYVRSDALASLPAPTTFEPVLALDGGPDGLVVIDRLLDRLPTALAHGGAALLEIGADQGSSILEHVASALPGWPCVVEPDLAGHPRVARIERGPA
jgi:release factor glutamine methyltransferase